MLTANEILAASQGGTVDSWARELVGTRILARTKASALAKEERINHMHHFMAHSWWTVEELSSAYASAKKSSVVDYLYALLEQNRVTRCRLKGVFIYKCMEAT